MIRILTLAIGFSAFLFTSATTVNAENISDAQKAEIEKLIENYIANNGEKIIGSVNQYHAKLEEKTRKESAAKAKDFMKDIDTCLLYTSPSPRDA